MPRPRERSIEEIHAPVIFDENGEPLRDRDGNAVTTRTPKHVMDAKDIAHPVTMDEIVKNLREVMTGESDPKVAASRVAAARLIAELAKMIRGGDHGPRTAVQVNIMSREAVKKQRESQR